MYIAQVRSPTAGKGEAEGSHVLSQPRYVEVVWVRVCEREDRKTPTSSTVQFY